jgi:hypothetical protein
MTSPVFFDGTGRRRRLVGRIAAFLLLAIMLSAGIFAATVVNVPSEPAIDFGREREQPLPFLTHVARLKQRLRVAPQGQQQQQLRSAFTCRGTPDSATSLRRHYASLDWVVTAEGVVDTRSGFLTSNPDPRLNNMIHSALHRPQILGMVQNIRPSGWDGAGMERLLHDRPQDRYAD